LEGEEICKYEDGEHRFTLRLHQQKYVLAVGCAEKEKGDVFQSGLRMHSKAEGQRQAREMHALRLQVRTAKKDTMKEARRFS